jgi:hypothetical protein
MNSIKEFIDSRDCCLICGAELELSITSSSLHRSPSLSLKNNILSIKSIYFNIDIDLLDNSVLTGVDKSHWEFKLSLFCPLHTDINEEKYRHELIFDIYCGTIVNESSSEFLTIDNFTLQSYPSDNRMEYYNLKSNKKVTFPYFDYSKMSLSKLKSKLKTYLVMQ